MDTRDMKSVSTKQLGIANTAKKYPHEAITVLHPYLDEHWFWEASHRVRKSGATGVDGQSHADYEKDKTQRLKDLLRRAKDGSYRAPPVKRVYIPKYGGEKRGIGIPTYEDKILQRAVVMLLEPIYEGEFHDFSFGFRPNKSPHQTLKYLRDQCYEQDVAYVLDVDLRKYFDTIDHAHLREILHRRVGDGVITRLINKWLKAGVWEEGTVEYPEAGSPQGGVISPLLSNVYLHTVLDNWYVNDIQPHLQGKSFMVRYADDFVMGFANKSDAESMLDAFRNASPPTGCNSIQRKRDWCSSNDRANIRAIRNQNPRASTSSASRITGANRSTATMWCIGKPPQNASAAHSKLSKSGAGSTATCR
jgi:retron-type reverse transcriptase